MQPVKVGGSVLLLSLGKIHSVAAASVIGAIQLTSVGDANRSLNHMLNKVVFGQ